MTEILQKQNWLDCRNLYNDNQKIYDFIEAVWSEPLWAQTLDKIFMHSPYLSHIAIKNIELLYDIYTADSMSFSNFDNSNINSTNADNQNVKATNFNNYAGYIHSTPHTSPQNFKLIFDKIIDDLHKSNFSSQEQIMRELRIAKGKIALLIAIADIMQIYSLSEITNALSCFADKAMELATSFLLKQAHLNGEIKLSDVNNPLLNSGLIILAMGKLGANELNYSSDIDFIILYEDKKINYLGRYSESHFFVNFTNKLINIINERTRNGYVFRTDLRLRPDPSATSRAVSLKSATQYYQTVGQNWERAAMIKSRIICGDQQSYAEFTSMIQPFIWRRELDFANMQDIHSIKRQINSKFGNDKGKAKGQGNDKNPSTSSHNLYNHNIKLGHGGIREIEFFVQTQQLIWGGRREYLQVSQTCEALKMLVRADEITQDICDKLTTIYEFYRTLEHRIQMINDAQTHTLPDNEIDMISIAQFMGFDDVNKFTAIIINNIITVQKYYTELFADSPSLTANLTGIHGNLVFTGIDDDPETINTLNEMGFPNPSNMIAAIRGWHYGRHIATQKVQSRELLTELMPSLLLAFSKSPSPGIAFLKFDDFLSKISSHTQAIQIFSLLKARPQLLDLIAEIMGIYPKIAEILSHNPSLMDYVLAPEFYKELPQKDEMLTLINEKIQGDFTLIQAVERIKLWANDMRFRIAVQFIQKTINARESAIALSNLADSILITVTNLVQNDFAKQYGTIKNGAFEIVALGRLGGMELTFNSDLDIIFLYNCQNIAIETKSLEKNLAESKPHITQLNVTQYYTRISKIIINILTGITKNGVLYEVDTRLRPEGESGSVVSSIMTLEKYYANSAWAWEYMALSRARTINITNDFSNVINKMISQILSKKWDNNILHSQITWTHKLLRKNKTSKNIFDIKNIDGGQVDLEYIIQYLTLNNNLKKPSKMQGNSIIAIQELDIPQNDKDILSQAANLYIETQSILRLTYGNTSLDEKLLSNGIKQTFANHTNSKDFVHLKKKLVSSQKNIKNLFDKYL